MPRPGPHADDFRRVRQRKAGRLRSLKGALGGPPLHPVNRKDGARVLQSQLGQLCRFVSVLWWPLFPRWKPLLKETPSDSFHSGHPRKSYQACFCYVRSSCCVGLFRSRTAADDFHRQASRRHLPWDEGNYSTTDASQVGAGTKEPLSMAVVRSEGDTNRHKHRAP